MTTDAHTHPNYLAIWLWLMGLALIAVVASQVHLPPALAALIIYGTAAAKAVIVALYFMHLKKESVLIIFLVLTPIFLGIILLVGLLPDFVFSSTFM